MNHETAIRATWHRLKARFPTAVVLILLGDFYEAFDDDASTVSDVCDVVLCSRKIAPNTRIPMAGFPDFTIEARIKELVDAGHRVVVAEGVGQRTIYEPEQLTLC